MRQKYILQRALDFSLTEALRCFERDIAKWESAGRPDMRGWEYWEVRGFYKTDDEEDEEYMKIIRRFGVLFTHIHTILL